MNGLDLASGSQAVFARVKIILALGMSLCIYPLLLTPGSSSAALIGPVIESGLGLWSLIGTIAAELLIGVVIGFGASMPLIGVQVGGRMVDQQMGMGLAGVVCTMVRAMDASDIRLLT